MYTSKYLIGFTVISVTDYISYIIFVLQKLAVITADMYIILAFFLISAKT